MDSKYYYKALALAYVRGKLPDLEPVDDDRILKAARENGLRLHRFKRTTELPRVKKVLGVLKSFAPHSLLDIGSGRGAFLWPLLDEFSELNVTAVDVLKHRVEEINAVRLGGFSNLQAEHLNADELTWQDDFFDAVTVLEVLEHVENPESVARQVLRVAGSVVIASVPAKEDDNPGHVRLFTPDSLTALFMNAGAANVSIAHVPNHMIAVVRP